MQEIMSKNDLLVNEKRWRRKRLFLKKRRFIDKSFVAVLLVIAMLVILGWWFEVPLYELLAS